MSFLVTAALAVGLLVGVPIVAHLLRRGRTREQPFPPASLVPVARSVARQRSRLEDRALLLLRAAIIIALAMLGATPLVRCSRLSLGRESGASVALALVIDDSLSMRAKVSGGRTRWDLALRSARELLDSAREGDAVAIVLAGRPARLALSATTDLSAVRRALGDLRPSDRGTDLEGALALGRASIAPLPHADKRVVVLSDLASNADLSGTPPAWTPVAALTEHADDCGISRAERRGRHVAVTVACNSGAAAKDRAVRAVAAGEPSSSGAPHAEERLVMRAGIQHLALDVDPKAGALAVTLSGEDALERNDRASVAPEASALAIGVNADPERSSAVTGGPPLIEQALGALDAGATLRPLTSLPHETADLRDLAAVVIDDPPGLTPEARSALLSWVEKGGVALALLGPRAATLQLGATLEPFAQGAVHWEKTGARGVDPATLSWLGPEAQSLVDLAPRARALLDGAEAPGARAVGRWDDGKAWLLERAVGRGALFTLALPTSIEHSDLALRPGFLALLDHVVAQARERSGPRQSLVGTEWTFPAGLNVRITGPDGQLTLQESSGENPRKRVSTASAGEYELTINGERQQRTVWLDPEEIITRPKPAPAQAAVGSTANPGGRIDASRELGWVLLALVALELGWRIVRSGREQRAAA